VDVGTIRLAPRAPGLRVESARGEPLPDVTVMVTRGARQERLTTEDGASAGVVLDPWRAPGLLADGALVTVPEGAVRTAAADGDLCVAFRARLAGPGPYTVRMPKGRVTIAPVPAVGVPVSRWVAFFDGRRLEAEGPTLRLVGVEDGPHEVVVDVPGTAPLRRRFTLSGGATLALPMPLSAAPR
jgi:hypothetical protein